MKTYPLVEKAFDAATSDLEEAWLTDGSMKWYDCILRRPLVEQMSYMIAMLDHQVQNGGFHQYFSNVYGQFAVETIDFLKRIGANQKSMLLAQAYQIVNGESASPMEFRTKLLQYQIPSLFDEDELFEPLDKLDHQYYSLDEEDVLGLLETHLSNIK